MCQGRKHMAELGTILPYLIFSIKGVGMPDTSKSGRGGGGHSQYLLPLPLIAACYLGNCSKILVPAYGGLDIYHSVTQINSIKLR